MYLNKIKLFLVISFFLSSFFLTLKDVKSYEIKVVDGDTIHLNGKKVVIKHRGNTDFHLRCIFLVVTLFIGRFIISTTNGISIFDIKIIKVIRKVKQKIRKNVKIQNLLMMYNF